MLDNPFFPLSLIAGPAILTNASAIMQNAATLRYNLAIPQWREFQTSLLSQGRLLEDLYIDADAALEIASRRIRLLLLGLNLLHLAVGLFATTSILGAAGAFMTTFNTDFGGFLAAVMIGAGTIGLACLLCAAAAFIEESRCASRLLALQLQVKPQPNQAWTDNGL